MQCARQLFMAYKLHDKACSDMNMTCVSRGLILVPENSKFGGI